MRRFMHRKFIYNRAVFNEVRRSLAVRLPSVYYTHPLTLPRSWMQSSIAYISETVLIKSLQVLEKLREIIEGRRLGCHFVCINA